MHEAATFGHPIGARTVARRHALVFAQIRYRGAHAGRAVEGPAVIAALKSLRRDGSERKRHTSVRAAIFQRTQFARGIAKQHERLAIAHHRERLLAAHRLAKGCRPPVACGHAPISVIFIGVRRARYGTARLALQTSVCATLAHALTLQAATCSLTSSFSNLIALPL